MFITAKEWRALSLRNRMLLLEAAANKSKGVAEKSVDLSRG